MARHTDIRSPSPVGSSHSSSKRHHRDGDRYERSSRDDGRSHKHRSRSPEVGLPSHSLQSVDSDMQFLQHRHRDRERDRERDRHYRERSRDRYRDDDYYRSSRRDRSRERRRSRDRESVKDSRRRSRDRDPRNLREDSRERARRRREPSTDSRRKGRREDSRDRSNKNSGKEVSVPQSRISTEPKVDPQFL